ncbi:MAG: peptidoglycan D,D-transpeptidase FtsI family protein [Lachnospiraceae bacterium]
MKGKKRSEERVTKNERQRVKKEEKNPFFEDKWYIKIFEPKRGENYNLNIVKMSCIFVVLFLFLMAYFMYFVIVQGPQIITSPYNKRQNSEAEKVERGKILSANDKVLAQTIIGEDGKEIREYPYENMFAHVVGYDIQGKSGIESSASYKLLGTDANLLTQLILSFKKEKNPGNNVVTSLDTRLQKAAYEAMEGKKGAVVAIEPSTGRVLAMVSKPDFNPNNIKENWDDLANKDQNATLLNRAIQDLYPPGSTFKTVTAFEYIKEYPDTYKEYMYDCDGSIIENGVIINCYQNAVHGTVNLKESMAHSCNTSFVNIGTKLNMKEMYNTCNTLMFNKKIPFDLQVRKSQYELTNKTDSGQIPQTMIGQGETLITPLHNALIMSAVANKGVMMKPTLVDYVESYKGKILEQTEPKEIDTVMTEEQTKILRDFLRAVVESGSASDLYTERYKAYGKTGSAEHGNTEETRAHAWFVGFASYDEDSDLVVSVIVENSGTGREYAVPVAKRLFESYYNNELYK